MTQIKQTGVCPKNKHAYIINRVHYSVILENGLSYNICSFIARSGEVDKIQLIMLTELVDICTSLFGNNSSSGCNYNECIHDIYHFPNNSYVLIDHAFEYYYYNDKYQELYRAKNLHEMIEYLKEKYASLLFCQGC